MAFSLGEYQEIFLEEADEQLHELNQNLLELEKDPDNLEIINNIFRAAHSLKSSAAFVGLNDLSDLAHKMENLLQGIREKILPVTSEIVDVIFNCFDMINSVIASVARGEEPQQDLSGLISEIESLAVEGGSGGGSKPEPVRTPDEKNSSSASARLNSSDARAVRDALASGQSCSEITVYLDEKALMKWVKAQLILNNLNRIGDVLKTVPSPEQLASDDMDSVFKVILLSEYGVDEIRRACNVDLVMRVDVKNITLTTKDNRTVLKFGETQRFLSSDSELGSESVNAHPAEDSVAEYLQDDEDSFINYRDDAEQNHEDIIPIQSPGKTGRRASVPGGRSAPVLNTVKVSVDKLDQLLNNVAELVIANSGFYRLYDELRKSSEHKAISSDFKNRMEQMSRIAKDLQTGIMKTRMVQIGQIFTRFNRLVRDLAKEFGKNVKLTIKGEETELDKKVIDSIGEPLLHLIRNAIDHGIENSEERKTLGKSASAQVVLNAYQGGNQIFVEVSDDGRGLNVENIRRKALEKGLVTYDTLPSMDDQDIYNFIFMPGFSTTDRVTDVSGRGVGMNVVKEIISELNGNVNIETEPGMGTRFIMSFPLTLAIIPAIMVMVRKEMYAIPLSDVIETIKINPTDITTIEGHEVLNFRGEILSLLRLSSFIKLKSGLAPEQKIPVVVVGFGNRKIGLMVDSLEGKQEIVIKSLEQNYKTVEGLAGASILGDGSICLILDIASMINMVISDQDKFGSSDFEEDIYYYEEEARVADESRRVPETAGLPQDKTAVGAPDAKDRLQQERTSRADSTYISFMEESKKTEPPETASLSSGEQSHDFKEKSVFSVPDHLKETEEESGPEPSRYPFEKAEPDIPGKKTEDPSPVFSTEGTVAGDSKDSKKSEIDKSIVEFTEKPEEKKADETSDSDTDENIKKRVRDTLADFKRDLRSNVDSTLETGKPSDHMSQALNVKNEDISEFRVIANIGAANAADSLSRILDKRIDLTIPEVSIKPIENIPEYLGNVEKPFFGILLPIKGEGSGTILFSIRESSAFKLVEISCKDGVDSKNQLTEDGASALEEITNIIGSSIINVFADKTGLIIKPGMPNLVHDFMQAIIDSILVSFNVESDYAIVMDTAFFFENDQIIGNVIIIPDADFFKTMVERLRMNVRTD